MYQVDFVPPSGSVEHECESISMGDWIVFRCPICKDYFRSINLITGEMKVGGSKESISHSGKHYSPEFAEELAQDNSSKAKIN
jgi:hypothetical protein